MLLLYFFLSFGLQAYAQSPGSLGNFPLAVKTPYLHTWIQNTNRNAPQQEWPQLFTQGHILGWDAMIRVDGKPYQWMGNSDSNIANFSTTSSSEITPTSTIFTIQAGPMKFKATFFTPIEPNNYTRQSIPFTYLFVDGFVADDGNPHTIQLYSEITGEFISHDTSTEMRWGTQDSPEDMIYHHLEPRDPKSMTDNADSAEDATVYYATPKRPGLTWQTGDGISDHNASCRPTFAQNGNLTNIQDTNFRPVNSKWPGFCFGIDLGSIDPTTQPDPVVWALGLVRDPLVNYSAESGFQRRIGYYWSAYRSIDDVISDFLGDFTNARVRGQAFDDGLLKEASAISPQYAGIISLVTRQIFASMDITIADDERGRTSPSDVKVFMKDISVSKRVNPVEVIYAALPALLYFNASFAHDLLLPLFEFQSSSSYPNGYASPDLGSGYPTIRGNTSNTEELAIEYCGNMLIMAYAHAAKSGDDSLISKYHPLLQKWAAYLAQHSLHPNNAVSADGIGYPEMSNLALKGILGVYSMGKIDDHVNPSNTTFKDKANELIQSWKQLAVTDTHIQAEYGKPGTWGLMYNLFPAVWLETGLIDDEILNREAQFYLSKTRKYFKLQRYRYIPIPYTPFAAAPTDQSYGLDDNAARDIAYPHWSLMTAAIMPSGFTSVRDTLIQSTHLQAYNISQKFPLPMRYTASTGDARFGTIGSAAQGAAFGILAMKFVSNLMFIYPKFNSYVMSRLKNVDIIPTFSRGSGDNAEKNAEKRISVSAIVGGVIGGLAFLLIVGGAIFFWRRRQIQRSKVVISPLYPKEPVNPQLFTSQYAPISSKGSVLRTWAGLVRRHMNHRPPARDELCERFSELHDPGRPYNRDTSRRDNRPPIATKRPPIMPPQLLSSKEREVPRQHPSHSNPSEPAQPVVTIGRSAAGPGGDEILRAEVEELRREMEAIRDIAHPPPSYH
ncbi:hypothetical protein AGABI2DRAFT_123370 [Agaricus bisporus var. bisporus H97]|uniref:hypothetical protein n=1 Tax=Agaricus bisporus var. bisporus (strain H97 / ATCC MYA-4626 / FGSC 10389) TaxID=936046 RepID=UPI00029F6E7F|nr:hypothetical protein AGABI2DRAFT_123370 [Agaricus bisporus var. bisporus H97]EKV41895.1 hypothetical protein AGABI2DRAFT_123370 [Agaricus bisporus var. bisporus H97]